LEIEVSEYDYCLESLRKFGGRKERKFSFNAKPKNADK
jgi:hypothetical protein